MSSGNNLKRREEVVNTELAHILTQRGGSAEAEIILSAAGQRGLPDVLLDLRGLRVVLECKFSGNGAKAKTLAQANERIRTGLANIAVAVVYPPNLKTAPLLKLSGQLESAVLNCCIISEISEIQTGWFAESPAGVWFQATPPQLMESLRRVQEALVEDDFILKSAKSLSAGLDAASGLWAGRESICDRLSEILGIGIPMEEKPKDAVRRRKTAAKVAALALANALIFQEQLSAENKDVSPISGLAAVKSPRDAAILQWRKIHKEINYAPIFQLGESIMLAIPSLPGERRALAMLIQKAREICGNQAALRHDLMGRIYHFLLHEAKYLGTYYTSTAAATLLLKLALDPARWKKEQINFGDSRALAKFKTTDLACGTGTLLMAAAQALVDNFVRERAESGQPLAVADFRQLHRCLMEGTLHGYDVLPSAVHLTASTLALLAPEVSFAQMNLFVMPLGMDQDKPRLGSVDFLDNCQVPIQFSLDGLQSQMESVRVGSDKAEAMSAPLHKMDLCVMNPPFTRSANPNLLFGSIPDQFRSEMRKELKRRVTNLNLRASIQAGLGAIFVALADKHLKKGGRLAFVLPRALASGEAWSATRNLLAADYHLEWIVSSHDATRPNFSENTNLSEILFVARKLENGEKAGDTAFVNLWRNPTIIHEAMPWFWGIQKGTPAKLNSGESGAIYASGTKIGEMICAHAGKPDGNWTPTLFAQSFLWRIYERLQRGKLRLPTHQTAEIPLRALGDFGEIGPDIRGLHDNFKVASITDEWSSYTAFWNHDSRRVCTIAQKANASLAATTTEGKANHLWKKAGDIMIAERLRLNTHRVLAVGLDSLALSNTWWELKTGRFAKNRKKALLLWLNSSLGLLLYYGRRVISEGAFINLKKPACATMPVLDVFQLDAAMLKKLSADYDRLCTEPLKPLAQLGDDSVRKQIDDVLCDALRLPRLNSLRELMSREPGLANESLSSSPSKPK